MKCVIINGEECWVSATIYDAIYQQGRLDAFKEVDDKVEEWDRLSQDGWLPCGQIIIWLEELKEKSNEGK